jgi:hypothetical protein
MNRRKGEGVELCRCEICTLRKRVEQIKAKVSTSVFKFIEELADRLCDAEERIDVWKAKALGTWPGWEHNRAPSPRRSRSAQTPKMNAKEGR